MLTILLQLAGGTAFLYYGADFLVKGGVSIATRFGVSALVIGLTLVAFATSSWSAFRPRWRVQATSASAT